MKMGGVMTTEMESKCSLRAQSLQLSYRHGNRNRWVMEVQFKVKANKGWGC